MTSRIFGIELRRSAALALLPGGLAADSIVADRGATAQICTTDAPKVCVTMAHAAALDDLRGAARQVLAIPAAKLPNPPTMVVEDHGHASRGTQPQPQRADTVLVGLSGVLSDATSRQVTYADPAQVILWQLLDRAGTEAAPRPPRAPRSPGGSTGAAPPAWSPRRGCSGGPRRSPNHPTNGRRPSRRWPSGLCRPCAACRPPSSGLGWRRSAWRSWPATAVTCLTSSSARAATDEVADAVPAIPVGAGGPAAALGAVAA